MKYFICIKLLLTYGFSTAQGNFTSSNLPIIIINTNGQNIVDEPKITADMGIIYNGPGQINKITDAKNNFNGKIGIELRGSTSQSFPKKPYGIETRDNAGEDLDVSLLGMPKESDWTLNATYNDKSLMRDGLAYILAGAIMEYAPRVRYCELVLNNDYKGVYLLIEKIKRDKNRVDIAKMEAADNSGDALTGGYIIKLDKTTGTNSKLGWFSQYKPLSGAPANTYFQYEYPSVDNITSQQQSYIKNHINQVEAVMAGSDYKDKTTGFRKYFDVNSLIDFIIINELTKNPDGYRLSTFFFKERDSDGGLIKFGPVWDFNLGFGNVNYCTKGNPEGLVILDFNNVCPGDYWLIHFWWKKFLDDPDFYIALKKRWIELRKNQFSSDKIQFKVDSIATLLGESQVRNFARWPVLGQYIWPNSYIGKTYNDEVIWLKSWINSRINYLDYVWNLNNSNITKDGTPNKHMVVYPNPSTDNLTVWIPELIKEKPAGFLVDYLGKSIPISDFTFERGTLETSIAHVLPGFYLLNIMVGNKMYSSKVVKL